MSKIIEPLQSGTFSHEREKEKKTYRENMLLLLLLLLRHGCAGSAVNEAPEQWQRCAGKARRVARGIAPSLLPAQGCAVNKPPEYLCAAAGQDARRPLMWGGLLFGYSSLGHARESNSLAGSE